MLDACPVNSYKQLLTVVIPGVLSFMHVTDTITKPCFVCCRCVFAFKFCLNAALCRIVSKTTAGQ